MPSMFDTPKEASQPSSADETAGLSQDSGNVPGRTDPLQPSASDMGTEQNWDTFHQHMLLVVQATQNLGVKLTAIFNP